ncbi:hypothetical protein ACNSPG_12110 [Brucella pituitosa]
MTSQSEDANEGDIELLVVDSDGLKLKYRLRLSDLLYRRCRLRLRRGF